MVLVQALEGVSDHDVDSSLFTKVPPKNNSNPRAARFFVGVKIILRSWVALY